MENAIITLLLRFATFGCAIVSAIQLNKKEYGVALYLALLTIVFAIWSI